MLWERKIHLEKEMQLALDPTVGEGETAAADPHPELPEQQLW